MMVHTDARMRVVLEEVPNVPPCTPKTFTKVVTNPENALTSPAKNKFWNSQSCSFFLTFQSQAVTKKLRKQHT